jgi:hypothetical protein
MFGDTCGVRFWASVRVVYCSETAIDTKTAKKSKNFFITNVFLLIPWSGRISKTSNLSQLLTERNLPALRIRLRKSEFIVPLPPFLHKAGDAFVIGKIGSSATGHHSNFVRYISPC